jgi:type II secretory pathway component GspD/PulD (secretin)
MYIFKTLFVVPVILAALHTGAFAEESLPQSASDSKLLSLEISDVEIMDVLKLISKKSGLNIVAGKDIRGQVSIFLKDVPVRDGLKTILQSQNLAFYEEDNIIKVITDREYQEKYGRPFGDVRLTRTFSLANADVNEIANTLNLMKSPTGRVLADARVNALVITETPQVLEEMARVVEQSDAVQVSESIQVRYAKIEDLEEKIRDVMKGDKIVVTDIPSRVERVRQVVEAFDVKSPQVLIEAKVIEVELTDSHRQGINWNAVLASIGGGKGATTLALPLTVSAPTGAALTTLTSAEGDLTLILQAIESMGKSNTLSSPRITAINNEEARLSVATKRPYVSQTVVQTTNATNTADNVQFIDVGVTLTVQPRILSDGLIEMKIKPQVSSSNSSLDLESVSSGSNTAFTRTSIPIVTTQELETTVTVKSGTTVIVGGLIQDSQNKQSQKVPVVGSLPIVGQLFSSRSNDFSKTELVMFLTPTIVEDAVVVESKKQEERFLDGKGVFKAHEKVGEYSGAGQFSGRKSIVEPMRTFPYWKNDAAEKTK